MYVVTAPVANLRREPIEHSGEYTKDPLQETQLLFGEPVIPIEEKAGWVYVQAIEQQKYSTKWVGYPGWIQKTQLQKVLDLPLCNLITIDLWNKVHSDSNSVTLSFGTKLQGLRRNGDCWSVALPNGTKGLIHENQVKLISEAPHWREDVVTFGEKFLGFPYLWGGRSAYDSNQKDCITSVDCSGYVQLLYRVVRGMDIPRDAHDQYLKAQSIEKADLLPGDLIFMEPVDKPGRMNHVMLYAGGGYVLEATMASKSVRYFSLEERITKDYKFYFGTYV